MIYPLSHDCDYTYWPPTLRGPFVATGATSGAPTASCDRQHLEPEALKQGAARRFKDSFKRQTPPTNPEKPCTGGRLWPPHSRHHENPSQDRRSKSVKLLPLPDDSPTSLAGHEQPARSHYRSFSIFTIALVGASCIPPAPKEDGSPRS